MSRRGWLATGFCRNPTLSSARLSVKDAGSSMGTLAYMAPEQARDATSVDHRADIYSLGCTFYALVTGRPPFHAKTVKEMMDQHRTAPFPQARSVHADIPEAMDRIIARMTARDAAGRHAVLGEAIAELEKCTATAENRLALASEQNIGRLNMILRGFNPASLLPLRRFGPVALAGLAFVLVLVLALVIEEFSALKVPVNGSSFRSLAPGIVGMLILASVFASGWRCSLVAIPAALVCLLGPSFGIPNLGFAQGDCWLSALAAIAMLVVGGLAIRQIERGKTRATV